ncbi:MAG: site-2 protease family protein [Candidatus Pacebacteria bacterium]|nr:site-2 protease family protein [Candidatus Paceibacterota bacterium]
MLYFILIIITLIFTHELGHFLASKMFNVKVEEFGIGFPPRIFKFKKGETVYSLNLIPLGGFCKILGENENIDNSRSFSTQPAYKKIIILLAGVAFNFLFAIILYSILFSIGLPSLTDFNSQDIYQLSNIAPKEQFIQINKVQDNSIAKDLGFKVNDKILSFNNRTDFAEFSTFLKENKNQEITLNLENKDITFTNPDTLGIYYTGVNIYQSSFFQSIINSFKVCKQTIVLMFSLLGKLFTSIFSTQINTGVAGPIGIISITQSIANLGFIYVLSFAAYLSINLGFVNLIPISILDGGRVLMILIEKIFNKKILNKINNLVNYLGIGFLGVLMIIITIKDILKIFK